MDNKQWLLVTLRKKPGIEPIGTSTGSGQNFDSHLLCDTYIYIFIHRYS